MRKIFRMQQNAQSSICVTFSGRPNFFLRAFVNDFIELHWRSVQLEAHKDCIYDRLEIYDGTAMEPSALLSKLCGQVKFNHILFS